MCITQKACCCRPLDGISAVGRGRAWYALHGFAPEQTFLAHIILSMWTLFQYLFVYEIGRRFSVFEIVGEQLACTVPSVGCGAPSG